MLHALTEWGKVGVSPSTGPSNDSIRASYLDWLRGECETVDLLGLDLKDSYHNVRLGQVYVPAVTAAKPKENGAAEEREREPCANATRSSPASARRSVALRARRAGSGKSTFCRWAALSGVSRRGAAALD